MEGNRNEFNQPCVKIASRAELKQSEPAVSTEERRVLMWSSAKGNEEMEQGCSGEGKKCVCMKECNVISYIHGGQKRLNPSQCLKKIK